MWPSYSRECRKEIDGILRKGKSLTAYRANASVGVGPAKGSQAYQLEREIERKFKVRHAVAVNSGTAALHAALHALDLRGREVIVPPFSFSATVSAVLMAGGVPRFCDIDQHTFCLDPKEVKRAITKKTAAILPVHLFGYFQDLEPLKGLGIPIIEDACQAVGAMRCGVDAGTQRQREPSCVSAGTGGIAGAYSFNGSKNIPTGEGGCLVTNDDRIAEKARRFINHGENFGAEEVGVNHRMHELVACLARHGLESLDERNERRRELAKVVCHHFYDEFYPKAVERIGFPYPHDATHAFYVTPLILFGVNRPRFIARCAKRGLPMQVGYTTPLHRLPAFRKYQTSPLPVTEELHDKTLCLLTNLTPDKPLSEAQRTAKIIREALCV